MSAEMYFNTGFITGICLACIVVQISRKILEYKLKE